MELMPLNDTSQELFVQFENTEVVSLFLPFDERLPNLIRPEVLSTCGYSSLVNPVNNHHQTGEREVSPENHIPRLLDWIQVQGR